MSYTSSIIRIENANHSLTSIFSEQGSHRLRLHNNRLQAKFGDDENSWRYLDTLSPETEIRISPNVNNALQKLGNGYYVSNFVISNEPNNAIIKKLDGYYVERINDCLRTRDLLAINKKIEDTENLINKKIDSTNERLTNINIKLNKISANLTKVLERYYFDNNNSLILVEDINALPELSSNVILNTRILVQNKSSTDTLELKLTEHDIETMNVILKKAETQQYDLDSANNVKIYIKGNYSLYIHLTYI